MKLISFSILLASLAILPALSAEPSGAALPSAPPFSSTTSAIPGAALPPAGGIPDATNGSAYDATRPNATAPAQGTVGIPDVESSGCEGVSGRSGNCAPEMSNPNTGIPNSRSASSLNGEGK